FEYMAMGGAIVASDLEQIGEILSPALRVSDLKSAGDVPVRNERAVLCTPGVLDEFVDAVVQLAQRPQLWPALGRNARSAVEAQYSWTRHVARLWPFAKEAKAVASVAVPSTVANAPRLVRTPQVETGDAYKDEVQKQWDNDPA